MTVFTAGSVEVARYLLTECDVKTGSKVTVVRKCVVVAINTGNGAGLLLPLNVAVGMNGRVSCMKFLLNSAGVGYTKIYGLTLDGCNHGFRVL